ncbi:hypothetical protein B566_EDAN013201 [Ephemera danica]|nr:hypothetical protein B566_EDAN013201 [Ephemera danica]
MVVLNLAKNKIQHVERGSFERNERLEAIRLDANYLTDVNGVFTALPALVWLNLSDNHLVWFDYAFVPPSLQWLDIHANFVEKLGNYYEIVDGFHLRTIDVSHNRLSELTPLSLPNSVEIFFANNNQITRVAPGTFSEKRNLTRVDLYANELEYLDLSALVIARNELQHNDENVLPLQLQENARALPEFFLGGNPFRCDCSMEWLQRVNNMSSQLQQYPRVMDLDDVVCRMTHTRNPELTGGNASLALVQPVLSARASSFLCRYETHCFALCHCCDFEACDCEMTCPQNCTCYHDQLWNTNVVDCSAAGHVTLPSRIPIDATELYLDGNAMRELRNHAFIGRKKMRVLYLNGSLVESIQNRTFNGLISLESLYLHDNRLRVLRGFEFEQLSNLRELFLQNNRLSHITNTTFLPLRSLRLLRLDGNRLASLPMWQVPSHNPQLTEIALANNPWACRCRFSTALRSWLQLEGRTVVDNGAVQCIKTVSEPCSVTSAAHDEEDEEFHAPLGSVIPRLLMNDYLPTVVCTLLVVLLVLVLAVLAFAYRDNLRLWVFARYGVRLFHKTSSAAAGAASLHQSAAACKREERDKLYDAYVCYSRKDEEQLVAGLATGLEAAGYGVCLHHRDLPCAGGSRDPAVLEAAEASRRVILVVTRGFMQTEWPRRELRAALHEALHARTFKLVIVEEAGGLAPELERDPDLRPYLKTARRIRWGDKKFWERLRYAMPEVRSRENQYRQNINYTLDSRGRHQPLPANNCTFPGKRKQQHHVAQPLPPLNNHPLFNLQKAVPESPAPSPRTSEHIYSSIEPEYAGSYAGAPSWPSQPPMLREPGGGQAYLV